MTVLVCLHKLTTDVQHAYKAGHSTCTAQTQMTDDWLKDTDNKIIVEAVLLDFSAELDVIDHDVIEQKLTCYGFKSPAITWLESYLSNRTLRLFFNGSFSNIRYV